MSTNLNIQKWSLRAAFSLLLVLLSTSLFPTHAQQGKDWFSEGQTFIENGDENAALELWLKAYQSIEDSSLIDPRIGSAFGKIIAKYGVERYFGLATEIYYWSLSSTGKGEMKDHLLKEFEKAAPVFEDYDFRDLMEQAEKNPYQTADVVISYWKSLDPTPETPANERLLEHWKRIIYAKQHFTKNDETIYGTDERAIPYLRYGTPDLKNEHQLDLDEGFLRATLMELGLDDEPASYLVTLARQYHSNRPYEVWVYNRFSSSGNIVKIFAETATNREFREIESVTEFIPISAFRNSESAQYSTPSGQTKLIFPGTILLYGYLNQFQMYDGSLASLFSSMNADMNYASTPQDFGWQQRQKSELVHQQKMVIQESPVQQSEELSSIGNMAVDHREYLFYDENNAPYYMTVMNTYPQEWILLLASSDEYSKADYRLNHSLSVVSFDGEDYPRSNIEPEIPVSDDLITYPAQSLFKLPAINTNFSLNYSAQLYAETEEEERDDPEKLIPNALKVQGSSTSRPGQELEIPETLTLSDIMIGYQIDESNWEYIIPFMVAIENMIPRGRNLFMHFQAINLEVSRGGSELELEFFVRKKRGALGKLFERDQDNLISIKLEEKGPQLEQTLEVELTDREPGKYELILRATDTNSDQSVSKSIPFEIFEPEVAG